MVNAFIVFRCVMLAALVVLLSLDVAIRTDWRVGLLVATLCAVMYLCGVSDEMEYAAGKTMSGVNTESGSPGAPGEPLGGDPHAR